MGRSVVVRPSYHDDISRLMRMRKSIEMDGRIPDGEKGSIEELIDKLRGELLKVEVSLSTH